MNHLRVVPGIPKTEARVDETIKSLDKIALASHIQRAFKAVAPQSVPRFLRQPPEIKGLSPEFGVGAQTDKLQANLTVHVDKVFLAGTLELLEPVRHRAAVGHFIVAAAAHSYIHHRPEVVGSQGVYAAEYRKEKAWRWASALAFNSMRMAPRVRDEIRKAYIAEQEEFGQDRFHDWQDAVDEAAKFGVEPPGRKSLPGWTFIGYPELPSQE